MNIGRGNGLSHPPYGGRDKVGEKMEIESDKRSSLRNLGNDKRKDQRP